MCLLHWGHRIWPFFRRYSRGLGSALAPCVTPLAIARVGALAVACSLCGWRAATPSSSPSSAADHIVRCKRAASVGGCAMSSVRRSLTVVVGAVFGLEWCQSDSPLTLISFLCFIVCRVPGVQAVRHRPWSLSFWISLPSSIYQSLDHLSASRPSYAYAAD